MSGRPVTPLAFEGFANETFEPIFFPCSSPAATTLFDSAAPNWSQTFSCSSFDWSTATKVDHGLSRVLSDTSFKSRDAFKLSAGHSKATMSNVSKPASFDQEDDELPSPRRPLTAYNLFFQAERKRLLESLPTRPAGAPKRSHGKIGFASMAKHVAGKWKSLDSDSRREYEQLAAEDKSRYNREKTLWTEKLRQRELSAVAKEIQESLQKTHEEPAADYEPLPVHSFADSSFVPLMERLGSDGVELLIASFCS